ncbi:MAG: response regulator [Candidatus Bathyarchaeia archaeon]|jgi:CheY-like chemotaxis protein
MISDKPHAATTGTNFKGAAKMKQRIQSHRRHTQLRVLHVDDDLNQLIFTKLFLEECDPNIKVESVSVPSEAVRALKVDNYDCVVSDYQMEEMDGIVLTRRVRELSDVPIIIYTGRGSEEVEELARAAGANGYVQKDIDPKHYRYLCEQIISSVNED